MYHTEEVGQKLIVQLPGKYVKDAHLKTGGPHRIKGVAQSRAKLFTIIEVNDILVAHVQHNYLPQVGYAYILHTGKIKGHSRMLYDLRKRDPSEIDIT